MPVFSNPAASYGSLHVGARIRRERKRRRWTLAELAHRFGVSIATMSAIENDKIHLTVDRLFDASRALDVRPDALFNRTETRHYHIARRGDSGRAAAGPAASAPDGGLPSQVLRPLAAPFVGKHMDPFEAALTPVPKARTPFLRHHHEEFLCILSGTIECLLDTPDGAVREQLSPGDCMYVRSHLLHGLRACAAGPAQAIRVLCAALGDSDLDRVEGDAGLAAASEVPDLAHTGARSHSAVPMKLGVLRQRFGWSLAEGASALGVSQRKLTAIERGRRPVGLDLLVRACSVYRKPVEYFLGSALNGPPYYSVHRARALRHLRPRIRRAHAPDVGPGYVYKSLADRFGARGMYPYYVKVPPHAPESTTLHEHHGQEFVYVLNGEVTLVTMLDGTRTTETLGRGDACYLDSSVPHRFIAAPSSAYGRRGAEVLGVFWCPLGEPYLFGDSSGGARTHRAARIRESSSKHDSG